MKSKPKLREFLGFKNLPCKMDFIAVHWDANWEFDRPIVLLEPYIRYGFGNCESIAEDLAIDISLAEDGVNKKSVKDEDISKEFEWRGWSINLLRGIVDNYNITNQVLKNNTLIIKGETPYNREDEVMFFIDKLTYEFFADNNEMAFRKV